MLITDYNHQCNLTEHFNTTTSRPDNVLLIQLVFRMYTHVSGLCQAVTLTTDSEVNQYPIDRCRGSEVINVWKNASERLWLSLYSANAAGNEVLKIESEFPFQLCIQVINSGPDENDSASLIPWKATLAHRVSTILTNSSCLLQRLLIHHPENVSLLVVLFCLYSRH